MTGVEVGFVAGIGAILGGAANWTRERWKGLNEAKKIEAAAISDQKRLAIQADQQEAQQALAVAPIWQDILGRVEARGNKLEAALEEQRKENKTQLEALRQEYSAQVESVRKEQHDQAIQYARLEASYAILQDRVKTLEGQLEQAISKHSSDAARIAALEGELAAAKAEARNIEAELSDNLADMEGRLGAAEKALRMKDEELRAAEDLIASMNQPDYSDMGGPPKPIEATLDIRVEKK